MEKKIYKLGAMMLALLMCVSFAACSSDDDDEGGSGTLTIGSENTSLSYAYYYYEEYDGWQIEFYSFDPTSLNRNNVPKSMNILSISIDGEEGPELPVGEFANAHLYVVKNMSMESEGQQYEGHATVNISKSGSTYTVKFSNATIGDDSDSLDGVSFTYSGGLTTMPEEYRD